MRRLALLSLLLGFHACTNTPPRLPPQPTGVKPASGLEDVAVEVVISGTFPLVVSTDFSQEGEGRVEARFRARLGNLWLEDVVRQEDGTLAARVPPGLAPGTHDLMVIGADAQQGILEGAFEVVSPAQAADLVAAYRLEPIEEQVVEEPFTLTVSAVDEGGAPLAGFNGTATLFDGFGQVVPTVVGPFIRGQWSGQVELRAMGAAVVLTVSDERGRTGSSNPFRVRARPPSALRFQTPETSVMAGQCSGAFVLEPIDAFGRPVLLEQDVPLTLSQTVAAGVTLYSDPACTSELGTPVLSQGASALTLFARGTRTGTVRIDAVALGLQASSHQIQLQPGAPDRLVFRSAPVTVNAGACSGELIVDLLDAFGNRAPSSGLTVVGVAASPPTGLTFHRDPACNSPVTSFPLAANESTGSFWVRGTRAGIAQVQVSSNGLQTAAQQLTIMPEGFPTRLVFITSPVTVTALACSPALTVQTQDSLGNAAGAPGAIQISLSASPPGGFRTYSDAACSVPLSAVTIPGGGNTEATFYFASSAVGTVGLTASAAGLPPATQTQTVLPGAAAELVIASAAQTLGAGSCSQALQFELRDAAGNLAPQGSQLAVTASTTAQNVTFYSDPGCTNANSAVWVPSGQSSGRVYFRGTQAGPVPVTLSASGLPPASQTQTVQAGPASSLAFSSAPQTVVAGACSGAVQVQARDGFGNAAQVPSAVALTLTAAPGAGFQLFSDATCTAGAAGAQIPASGTSATFFFLGTAAGNVAVTASGSLGTATQNQLVNPGPASELAFTSAPASLVAGGCSGAITVATRDAYGNPTPVPQATALVVSSSLSASTFFANNTCSVPLSQPTLPAGGQSAVFHYSTTRAGAGTLTASASGFGSASQAVTVSAGPPTQLAFVTPARSVNAGGCSAAVRLELRDSFGNPASPGTPLTLALSDGGATAFNFYADPACGSAVTQLTVPASSTEVSFHFSGTSVLTAQMTVSGSGVGSASQQATITSGGTASDLVFTTAAQTTVAGACSAAVTVQARDSFGNAVVQTSPLSLSLSAAPSGTTGLFSDPGCTAGATTIPINSGGSSASFYYRATAAGTVQLNASAAGLNPATQAGTVSAAAADRLVFVTPPRTAMAGACSGALTVEARDPFGNPSPPPLARTLGLTASPATGFTFHADSACATAPVTTASLPGGQQTATFYFKGAQAGTVSVSVSTSGMSGVAQAQTVSPAFASVLAVTSAPQSIQAGNCSGQVVIRTRDASGNPAPVGSATAVSVGAAPAGDLRFYGAAGCAGTPVSFVTIAEGTDTGAVYFRGAVAGSFTLSVSSPGMTGASQAEAIYAAPPDRLVFVSTAQTLQAGTCSPTPAVVEARDAYGNVSPVGLATTVTLTASPASGFTFHPSPGCGSATTAVPLFAGQSQASFYWRGTAAGPVDLTAAVSGWQSAIQAQAITAGPLASFSFDPIPSPQYANSTFGVAIRAVDALNNVVGGFTGSASLAVVPTGSVECVTACSSAGATSPFVAGVWTGSVRLAPPAATGVRVQATAGATSGQSNPFDLQGASTDPPPLARLTYDKAVIVAGQSILFDASGSSDNLTPGPSLEVSFDFEGSQAGLPPWTSWTTTKTASHTFTTAGTYDARVAVRDAAGGIGYAARRVVVLPSSTGLCTVTTNVTTDDGATSCAGPYGTDGKLSITEAVRLSNALAGTQTITFTPGIAVTSSTNMDIRDSVDILAPSNCQLGPGDFKVSVGTVFVSGLTFSTNSDVIVVSGATLKLLDSTLNGANMLLNAGRLEAERSSFLNCAENPCVRVEGSNASVLMRHATFKATGVNGLQVRACLAVEGVLVESSVFSSLNIAVEMNCNTPSRFHNNTFHANQKGIKLGAGSSHSVRNNIFTYLSSIALECGTRTFVERDNHVLFANANDGCASPFDPGALSANPQYVNGTAGDLRIVHASPARDSAAVIAGMDLNGPGPGNWFGSGPDRGGRESF